MKATLLLRKLSPERLFRRHSARRMSWQHWGEQINRRGLVVTEDEMRHHHRLEAQSNVERLSN